MAWIQLKFDYKNPDADSLSDYLMELGALAVTFLDAEDKPILEPKPGETPLWEHLVVLALLRGFYESKVISTQTSPLLFIHSYSKKNIFKIIIRT